MLAFCIKGMHPWAAQCNIWLLIELPPKCAVFSFPFLKGMQCDAEVINKVAFGENLGALEYEEQEDGTVQLATQEILEVLCSDQSLVFLTQAWTCCMTDQQHEMAYQS